MQFKLGRSLFALAVLGLTAACENPTDTLTTAGPAVQNGPLDCEQIPVKQDQSGLFQVAYYCAWRQAYLSAAGKSVDADETQTRYRIMLREGLGLVRGNCADFFRKRGDNQQQVNLGRDIVAMGGTTAAAIIGLTGGSALALSIIAVSGATLYAGIDTYTKNFLFGADNIEAVRTLTMDTIDINARAVLATPPPLSFQNVAGAIMDNQEMCKPASIAAAVRIKLRGGTGGIEAAGEDTNVRAQQDGLRTLAIADRLGLLPGASVSDTRLAAACWATTPDGMTADNLAIIKKWLPRDPYRYGPANETTWPGTSARVATECQALSSTMQAVIKKKIDELKGTAGSSTPPAPPPPPPPPAAGLAAPESVPRTVIVVPAPSPAPRAAPVETGPRFTPMMVR
jgi:hypothetical protein